MIIGVVLQSTVVPEIRIAGGGPDLILMLVLSWTLLADTTEGIAWAMVGGILQDIISGVPTGTTALALVIVAFLVSIVPGVVTSNNLIIPPVAAAGGTVIFHLVIVAVLAVLGRPVPFGYTLTFVTFPSVLFNAILMLPIFRVIGFVYNISQPRRVTL